MVRIICFCSAVFYLSAGFSQTTIKGTVVNSKNGEALPFVNLTIKGTTQGVTADVQGRFSITIDKPTEVIVTYVGFENSAINFSPNQKRFVTIGLKEKTTQLNEVIVRPGDNPALKIIRKVIANRPVNDPENLSSFTYNSYNKLYATLVPISNKKKNAKDSISSFATKKSATQKGSSSSLEDTVLNESQKKKLKAKKQLDGLDRFAQRNNLLMTESYTERKYRNPNFSKEIVLANKMTGVEDPFFAFLATDFQPFSFYKDFITLFDRNYISPISKGSISRYDYTLIDTLYHEKDSVFIISYEPLEGKMFDGLKGQLYISSDSFALEHVIAKPADDAVLVEASIQQVYTKTGGHWFPLQLNTELRFKEYQIGRQKLMYVSRSYISNVVINDVIPKKEFGLLNVQFAPTANRQSPTFWREHRADSLNEKEKHTYKLYDSIAPKLKTMNTVFKTLEGFLLGKFKAGSFYLPLEHLLKFNDYEGVRFGVGIETGESISKRFTLGGYVGYGLNDKATKYGAYLQANVIPNKEGFLKFSYQQDLNEPGSSDFIKSPTPPVGNSSYRIWYTSRMDSIKQYKVEFSLRPFRFSQVNFFVQQQNRNPAYAYKFITEKDITGQQQNYTSAEIGLQWRYAFKENYTQIGNGKVVTNYTYPQINLFASKGFTEFLNGQYNFTKVEARIDLQKQFRGLGQTTVQIDAGKVIGDVPYPFLFNAKGSKVDGSFLNNFVIANYFQTIGLYEFASNQFACLFFTHNIGRIAGMKSKFFRPELVLAHNMGVGSLQNKEAHQGIEIKSMEKGLFESGLLINNLIRFKYVNVLYVGIGAGAFYRYGNYALPNQADNLAFKINLTADF